MPMKIENAAVVSHFAKVYAHCPLCRYCTRSKVALVRHIAATHDDAQAERYIDEDEGEPL